MSTLKNRDDSKLGLKLIDEDSRDELLQIRLYGIRYNDLELSKQYVLDDIFLAISTKDALLTFERLRQAYREKGAPDSFFSHIELCEISGVVETVHIAFGSDNLFGGKDDKNS